MATNHGNTEAHPSPKWTLPLVATSILVALNASSTISWARRWTYSGCALESLLLIYGYGIGSRVLPYFGLWPLLATGNLLYAVCSTSWLLFGVFTALCYPVILLTCLWQFAPVAYLARRNLRRWLRQLHLTKDEIALFNLPALEIDVDVSGLLVVRGLSLSLSTLTLVAHGVELGIQLTPDIELAVSVDVITIALFRRIAIGDVFANVKGDDIDTSIAQLQKQNNAETGKHNVLEPEDSNLVEDSRGAKESCKQSKLRQQMTGVDYVKDTSAAAALDPVEVVALDDCRAEERYQQILTHINRSSSVGQSWSEIDQDASTKQGSDTEMDRISRVAIASAMQSLPSVPHPPTASIRVTTLQNLAPPRVRAFLHRLPLLLRLLLSFLSYLHPITVKCVTAGLPGKWLSSLLEAEVFKQYADNSNEVRRLEVKVREKWLENATFCMQLGNFTALAQVPVATATEITVDINVKDVRAYRSLVDDPMNASKVAQLAGVDASIGIPTFLLPHHEHIIPPAPAEANETVFEDGNGNSAPDEKPAADETEITFNVHASLPARFDQSLLGFIAALVKAAKVIEFENDGSDVDGGEDTEIDGPDSSSGSIADSERGSPTSSTKPSMKTFARSIRQNLRDGNTASSIKEFARDLNQSTRDSMKKAVIVGAVNDGWIAKAVGKIAANLATAKGSVGYAGAIPVPLGVYRSTPDSGHSKLLP